MSEIVKGSIYSYIYKSEDSLYKVARIETSNQEELVIIGNFLELEEGLEYEFIGEYIEHSKYGKQFKVETYNKTNSFSKEGLVAYLSSDKFYGVGEKLAQNIVDTLGIDCINKIIENPDVLDEIPKLPKAKKEIIVEVLKENLAIEQVYIKLYGFGLSSKMIFRLFEYYDLDAAIRIEENPYILLYDIEGFGFKKCDQLAMRLGFKENDKLRIKEAIRYTLNTICYQQGYTFLTETQLINSTINLLNNSPLITHDDLNYGLETLVIEGKVIKEEQRYFEASLYHLEIKCAESIKKLKSAPFKAFSVEKIKETIKQVQKDINICYTDSQIEAIINALTNKLSIITGGPGTGKSTILNGIIRCYAALNKLVFPSDELDMKIVMMAPTGRAAKRMSEVTNFKASTIHKALGYNYEGGFTMTEDAPLNCSLAIIDESSMIDISLATALFKALPLRCQIILVGDEFQLPSVGPGNVFHDLIASNIFKTVKLYEVMRQASNSNIIKLSNMIHSGQMDYRLFSTKQEVYFYPCDSVNLKDWLFKIIDAYLENGNSLETGIQILIPMYAGVAGIDAINEAISKRYNPSQEQIVRDDKIIKVNDKVLQLKNDPELKLMNGEIGIVKGITEIKDKQYLIINFDERMVHYPTKDLDNLRLAYAISVHKSQGSEYDNVILPILPSYNIMLRKKIIYTAITRAKQKLIILGNLSTMRDAIKVLEPNRQTALYNRLESHDNYDNKILDSAIPFDTLGEYDMEGITPYSFMD